MQEKALCRAYSCSVQDRAQALFSMNARQGLPRWAFTEKQGLRVSERLCFGAGEFPPCGQDLDPLVRERSACGPPVAYSLLRHENVTGARNRECPPASVIRGRERDRTGDENELGC